MRVLTAILVFVMTQPLLTASASAQAPTVAVGHWEGSIASPLGSVRVEIDLARDANGGLKGTFGQPAQNLKGYPLSRVIAKGQAVTFELEAGSGGGTFDGAVSADGTSMSGDYITTRGTVPFTLTRTGDARIEALPKGAPISKALEGRWSGALEVGGTRLRLALKMSNEADGTSTASLSSPDQGDVEIPVAVTQKGTSVTVDVKVTSASYAGTLNAAGTELVGTWSQGPTPLPLTFTRGSN